MRAEDRQLRGRWLTPHTLTSGSETLSQWKNPADPVGYSRHGIVLYPNLFLKMYDFVGMIYVFNTLSIRDRIFGLRKPEQSETSSRSLPGPGKTGIIPESRRSVTRSRFLFQVTNVDAKLKLNQTLPTHIKHFQRLQTPSFIRVRNQTEAMRRRSHEPGTFCSRARQPGFGQ